MLDKASMEKLALLKAQMLGAEPEPIPQEEPLLTANQSKPVEVIYPFKTYEEREREWQSYSPRPTIAKTKCKKKKQEITKPKTKRNKKKQQKKETSSLLSTSKNIPRIVSTGGPQYYMFDHKSNSIHTYSGGDVRPR